MAPNIAESWEIDAANNLLKFKIRQGVRWHNKPPMNGGELTPQDVVYNYVYLWSHPRTVYTRSYAHIKDLKKPQNSIYLDPNDPRTVIFEAGTGELGKAKQLLAEAGYPRGFKTSVNVSGAEEDDIDLLAVIKAYWGKVGVDMEIRVTEATVFATMTRNTSYEHGFMGSHLTPGSTISRFVRLEPNRTIRGLNDPWINNYMRAVAKTMAVDYKEKVRLFRELTPELHRRVDMIRLPLVTTYVVWQPWLKGYHGEIHASYYADLRFADYVWIDPEVKRR